MGLRAAGHGTRGAIALATHARMACSAATRVLCITLECPRKDGNARACAGIIAASAPLDGGAPRPPGAQDTPENRTGSFSRTCRKQRVRQGLRTDLLHASHGQLLPQSPRRRRLGGASDGQISAARACTRRREKPFLFAYAAFCAPCTVTGLHTLVGVGER